MLARVADSLYWMSRYLERAERTAQVVDVALDLDAYRNAAERERIWNALESTFSPDTEADDRAPACGDPIFRLTIDLDNPNSILACVRAARENARQLRDALSSEMWEQLNSLYLATRKFERRTDAPAAPSRFCRTIVDAVHQFRGVSDATYQHGQEFRFIELGRYVERAALLVLVLRASLDTLEPGEGNEDAAVTGPCVTLLRSCSALQGYTRAYTAGPDPRSAIEFLVLDRGFPNTLAFAARRIARTVDAIERSAVGGAHGTGSLRRLAGSLRARLEYAEIDEVYRDGGAYLDDVGGRIGDIHASIRRQFIDYPVDGALVQV